MRRERCGGCGSADLRQFLDLGETPLADDFPASPAAGQQQRWPLGAAVCESCWLVQLTEVVPDDVLWGGDYGFYTGGSPSSLEYFREYADDLHVRHIAPRVPRGTPFAVEVACNDGTLLELLNRDCRTLGVDPAKGPAEAARARGLDVVTAPFGREVAQAIVDTEGQADLVIANNVLAHVADLDDFVGGLALLLAPDGVLSVEVQYLGDLLLGNGFDLLYHEHRSFFSATSLSSVLLRHGLHAVNVRRTSAQGGSIRLTVTRDETASWEGFHAVSRTEQALWGRSAYDAMQGRADAVRDRLRDIVASERAQGRTVVGYGAPAKATTLLHWCGLDDGDIRCVVDMTESKHGRFMPGTSIPIRPPAPDGRDWVVADGKPITYLLFVHNYLPSVVRREREFLDRGGRFIVPLPVPVLL